MLSTLALVEAENNYVPLPTSQLTNDEFHLIADWYHFGILNLVKTKGFVSEPRWIARQLCISTVEVREALERLERLQLIKRVGQRLVRTAQKITTGEDVNSIAINTYHEQTLRKAIDCINEVPVSLRDNTAITMAIDVSKIGQAKKLIKNFRRTLSEVLEEGKCTEVYNLNIVLYPLTKGKQK